MGNNLINNENIINTISNALNDSNSSIVIQKEDDKKINILISVDCQIFNIKIELEIPKKKTAEEWEAEAYALKKMLENKKSEVDDINSKKQWKPKNHG